MDDLTSLLLAAQGGDRSALAAAIRAGQPEVWRMAAYLVSRDEADDVTQETFLRAWRALPAFRGDSSGRTWLLAIARRTCMDTLRAKTRRRRLTERVVSATRTAQTLTPGPEEPVALEELVGCLTVEQRAAFVLTQVLGCSYADAATACGVRIGTIRSRVARARVQLIDATRLDRSMEAG